MLSETNLIELERAVAAARSSIAQEKARHAKTLAGLETQLKAALTKAAISNAGLDLSLIQQAEQVIYVRGDADKVVPNDEGRYSNSRKQGIEDVIAWLIADENTVTSVELQKRTMSVKNYACFGDQRCDSEYGMGPRHGTIVFEIGLRPEARGRALTDDERNACIYYLRNIVRIQTAKSEAA